MAKQSALELQTKDNEASASPKNAAKDSEKEIDDSKVKAAEPDPKDKKDATKTEEKVSIDPKAEGELGLVSTILGCREHRDRIEFANDLKEFIAKQKMSAEDRKESEKTHLGLASDYKLAISQLLADYIEKAPVVDLAYMMPKYEFISPSLAMIIMKEIKKMLHDPELLEILTEKDTETKLPFDALRDLCSRFDRNFTDEHCAFITASYLTEIDEGIIYINFKEFMIDLKDPRAGKDLSRQRALSSVGSEGSDEI